MEHKPKNINEKVSQIIEMAWCDKTSFENIEELTGVCEKEVIQLMRRSLKVSSFKLWRKRVSGRKSKHSKLLKSFLCTREI